MDKQNQSRKSGAELPSAAELIAILGQESPRVAVRFDFLETHASIFDDHRKLSQIANSNDSWIKNYQLLTLEQLDEEINKNHAELTQHILQANKEDEDLLKSIYRRLIPVENLSKSDAIFVFGAKSNARIERAVELYKSDIAPKIIISGNRPFYSDNDESEAVRMSKVAIESGVPAENLILESKSITVPDNVKRTLDLMESTDWRPSSITVVATNFILQRAIMDWYKFTPWNIDIKAVAAHPQSRIFTDEGWYTDKESIALVLNEYAKLVIESKIDLLRRDGELLHPKVSN